MLCRVSPFGNLRINGHLHLPAAYRSLSRPSSAPDAKAFPLCSYQLDLLSFEKESRQRKLCARRMVTSVRAVCLSLPLSVEERVKLWFSLSLNYAGFRVFTKLFVLPFAKKFHKSFFVFPLLLALHTFGYFVQFSRCSFRLLLKSDPNTHVLCKCLNLSSKIVCGGDYQLYCLAYAARPQFDFLCPAFFFPKESWWWAQVDSNHRPHDYQSCALAS